MLLSIVITGHAEDLIILKTLKCIKENLAFLDNNDHEIIIHLDNPTQYLKNLLKGKNEYAIYENSFGDAGSSRNFAIKKAKGKYILVIDGDDMVSSNFIKKALKKAQKDSSPVLYHPEYIIPYDEKRGPKYIQKIITLDTKEAEVVRLLAENPYTSTVFGPREVFINYPYKKNTPGYGYEDYDFNITTLYNGVAHKTVPGTCFFYRQKSNFSMLQQHNSEHVTTYWNPAFDYQYWQSLPKELFHPSDKNDAQTSPHNAPKTNYKQILKKAYIKIRGHKVPNAIIYPFAELAKRITNYRIVKPQERRGAALPSFINSPHFDENLRNQMKQISQIEPFLYPIDTLSPNTGFIIPGEATSPTSIAYRKMMLRVTALPEYIFIVPWIQTGGADKVLVNILEAFKELYPKKKFAVITTLKSNNKWANKLPDNSYHLDFGNVADKLDDYWKEYLFTKLLVQLKCKKIHIINSQLAYEWIDKHRSLIQNENYKIDVSIYGYSYFENSNNEARFDYADPFATSIAALLHCIYTDNRVTIKRLSEVGLNNNTIQTLYQPIKPITTISAPSPRDDNKTHILWASRISPEKHPELVIEIAKGLDPDKYQIDMYGVIEEQYYHKKMFSGIPNLSYKGGFNGVSSLPTENYDIFLYTTLMDGLPNILLEISERGLPIIASNAGGVSDFIVNQQTGILIDDIDDAKSYIKQIKYASSHPDKMTQYSASAMDVIKKRHSWDSFIESLKTINMLRG